MFHSTRDNARICRGCWDQMHMPIPIRGPLAVPFRIFGITQSKMNPNICTLCERAFHRVKKQKHIPATATILFADIRGFTHLSERINPGELSDIVSTFQDQCAKGIWAHDGIVNKQMGDGLMSIFNFPIKIENHAEAAILAALEIQQQCKAALGALITRFDIMPPGMPGVGVGVHTGMVEIGQFSTDRSDFTALGGTVNLAARLEASAGAGEVLISAECAALAPEITNGTPTRTLELKGIEQPVLAHVLTVADDTATPERWPSGLALI
jgi:adenylate cyclase